MPTHKAETTWTGGKDGSGEFSTESGTVEGTFTFPTRFEDELGSNPEELIGAAHSGCFSMQLTAFLEGEGYAPTSLHTAADVHLDPADGGGFEISRIDLTLDADVPDIDEETFADLAQRAKENCPVSKALAGPELTLTATLA
ncbi:MULTISPECIES: OsmC family protein [unclassified Haloferax]|uniref:OsmC family protein n=1 Tax=Haloferax TaxID=2251 RepID=UPI0002B11E8E|nr:MULTISPECIES: OsmC family protein [unclassified Haloferax]ELZ60148.1 osmotically inducible protein OsmC [Haloferax sp. ATCC BAA-646]ELZ64360.1 osmotically inducible protein OsmC [Haloferax sp. ATCC BAA-645]ELZ69805.1 osmotically inducible protein OsmC [Haloferax sp. ATCC BAA-644]